MTRLRFGAPSDLSIGQIRITGAGGEVIASWTATPDQRQFDGPVAPGFYAAEITPVGLGSQSVVFEVPAGAKQEIEAPTFAWLQANNSNVTFLGVEDEMRAIESLFPSRGMAKMSRQVRRAAAESLTADSLSAVAFELSAAAPEAAGMGETSGTIETKSPGRRLSIGLSVDGAGGEQDLVPFGGDTRLSLTDGRIQLTVIPTERERALKVRMTVAIEDNRVESLFLPLYRDGVQVIVTPSLLSPLDIDLEVTPSDNRVRALSRMLVAGTASEAEALFPMFIGDTAPTYSDDPWEAMLASLVAIRFPAVLPPAAERLCKRLIAAAPWACDPYVIAARQRLYGAMPGESQSGALLEALEYLRQGQARGSPYFAYSGRLFLDLIDVLVPFFEREGPTAAYRKAVRIRADWLNAQTLQTAAGASFCWLRRDAALEKEGIVAPLRSSTGRLPSRTARIIFTGRLADNRIQMGAASQAQPEGAEAPRPTSVATGPAPAEVPALLRPEGPAEDPNLGRFGGTSVAGGYSLSAGFEPQSDPDWVTIRLTVAAGPGIRPTPGAVVWFCLHPSFDPRWVKVMMIDGRAELSVDSWGGFTVGAWSPETGVELELDLSTIDGAPDIVQTR